MPNGKELRAELKLAFPKFVVCKTWRDKAHGGPTWKAYTDRTWRGPLSGDCGSINGALKAAIASRQYLRARPEPAEGVSRGR